MTGRSKISENRRKKMGLAPLQHACKDIVSDYMDATHPLALTKSQQEQLEEVSSLTAEEFTKNTENLAKLALMQGLHILNRSANDIPLVKVSNMVTDMAKIIRDIQGQPSQRIEVIKKNYTPEEWNGILEVLPTIEEKNEISTSSRSTKKDTNSTN